MDLRDEFTDAYEAHSDALFRYAYMKLGDRERALDAVQDTFTSTWNYLAAGKEVKTMKPFLYRVLHNRVVNEYAKRKTVSLEQLMEDGFDEGVDERDELINKLDGAKALALIGELPEEYRDAIYMRYVEEFTLDEIAEATGQSKNVLAVRIFRGLRKLKKLYEHA
jgi:RNA polymerase sigma-70 factor, ECF subfamily